MKIICHSNGAPKASGNGTDLLLCTWLKKKKQKQKKTLCLTEQQLFSLKSWSIVIVSSMQKLKRSLTIKKEMFKWIWEKIVSCSEFCKMHHSLQNQSLKWGSPTLFITQHLKMGSTNIWHLKLIICYFTRSMRIYFLNVLCIK